MPTGKETVPNKALSGSELKSLLCEDFARLIASHGLLSDHMAFGRVSYSIRLDLHLDNPFVERTLTATELQSRSRAKSEIERTPSLAALEPPPLRSPAPSPDSIVSGTEVTRKVTSPNVERMRTGLPVPVEVKQQDGTIITEKIKYPAPQEIGDGDISQRDTSAEARADWNLPAAPIEKAPPPQEWPSDPDAETTVMATVENPGDPT